MADKSSKIRFIVDKCVSTYVLRVSGGVTAAFVVAFELAGLSWVMDVKVMPGS